MKSRSSKLFFLTILMIAVIGCKEKDTSIQLQNVNKEKIQQLLNQWHVDVATFDYEAYFNKMSDDAIFVGTDASEVWSKKEFQDFSKPHFKDKQTWDFKPLTRNIHIKKDQNIAWFDELLETWMGTCRGSGVVVHDGNNWKIQHYVLSVAIPNESTREVIAVKKESDSLFLQSINSSERIKSE